MRWMIPLTALVLGAGCDRDELGSGPTEELEDLPSSDHGSVVQEMGFEDARQALDAGDYQAFMRQIERHLESQEQWATTFQSDINTGTLRASPMVRDAFDAWQVEYATARQQYASLLEAEAVPKSAAEELYQRVERLGVDVRKIGALRRAELEGT